MKKMVLILAMVVSGYFASAQANDENSSLTRKEKRKIEMEEQFQLTKNMLENKDFVLESDFLQDRLGNRIPVSSNINFVAVDSTKAIIQVGSDFRFGPNGVGGITAKGEITSWKLNENAKSKSFSLSMSVMTNLGIYDLFFTIDGSGDGTALLTGLSSGRLTFDGGLVPWENSSVFVGQSL